MEGFETFETYMLLTPARRAEFGAGFAPERCGVEYELVETETVIAGFTLYCLHARRLTPTLKARLVNAAE